MILDRPVDFPWIGMIISVNLVQYIQTGFQDPFWNEEFEW